MYELMENKQRKFWFYVRKGIFQVLLQLVLAMMTVWDFAGQNNTGTSYNKLYFYTSFLLVLYTGLKQILEYMFSICSEEVVFKRELNNSHSRDILMSFDMLNSPSGHYIVTTKRIFKLRYSKSNLFIKIDKLCWFLGIDSPVLIPFNIIEKLGNIKDNLTTNNEDIYLNVTLTNLHKYQNDENDMEEDSEDIEKNSIPKENSDIDSLIPKVIQTETDLNIKELQSELFRKI